MADLTQGAVDGLLGLLTSAIKEETRLLGGIQGDIQFIKDEMDSMNGFLLHLTKTETAHNDQHRAWMKQVRDIAYIAQDCIELYLRDLSPPGTSTGPCARIRHLPVLLWKWPTRHNLANQLRELKDRVREVGERRLRYGVSVPETAVFKPEQAGKDSKAEEKMEEFELALEQVAPGASSPSFSTAIRLLPDDLLSEAGKEIDDIITNWASNDVESKKMLLRGLYAHPHVTKEELANLKKKLGGRAVDVRKEVMLFSYSKLSTHYKSCLQYMTAFFVESSISRTSLVRRWLAEGLVARDEGLQMEEAGERCFNELVFLGFVHRVPPGGVRGLKIKSCEMKESVKAFVTEIAKSENFVAGALPTHLRHQHKIREIARRKPPAPQRCQPQQRKRSWSSCNICPRKQQMPDDEDDTVPEEKRLPMDAMVHLLKTLPKEYRLNVLDLGGCGSLKDHHLKSIIGKVLWLKYLSIRYTDVTRLPKEINNLRRLETLDVRQTKIKAGDTTHVVLPELKHLLAGNIPDETDGPLVTVQMPRKLGSTEILRYVQVSEQGQAELESVGHLKKLRKLGVVIQGSEDNMKVNMKYLRKAIVSLKECLRSLSVWINVPANNPASGDGTGLTLDDDGTADWNATTILSSPPEKLESLNIKYFKGSNTSGSFPSWIQGLKLLSKITLRDTQLSHKSMETLGRLESLCCLRLLRGSYTEASINLQSEWFPKLRFLLIDKVSSIKIISFQNGAAPKLEKISWTLETEVVINNADTFPGINDLTSLQELELNCPSWKKVDIMNHAELTTLAAHLKHTRLRCQEVLLPCSYLESNTL